MILDRISNIFLIKNIITLEIWYKTISWFQKNIICSAIPSVAFIRWFSGFIYDVHTVFIYPESKGI